MPVTGIKCMAVLKALGEINRLRIMRLLLGRQLGVSAIARRLKTSEYNVSKHLRIRKKPDCWKWKNPANSGSMALPPG